MESKTILAIDSTDAIRDITAPWALDLEIADVHGRAFRIQTTYEVAAESTR